MRIRTLFCAAVAVSVAASCARVTDVTKISGMVSGEDVTEVNILVPDLKIDTTVAVKNGRFYCEIPADVTVMGSISAGDKGVQFVPDGTALKVELADANVVKSSVEHVQNAFAEYTEYTKNISEELRTRMAEIRSKAELSEEEMEAQIDEVYDELSGKFSEYNEKVVTKNNDNVVGLVALQNWAGELEDHQVDSVINTLSSKIKENKFVKRLSGAIAARNNTAEGKKFTDFTIENSDGKTVKFSDFVGKGKYVLVDFWASWCGPCKREIPNIKAVYDKYKGREFDVLSVAVWDRPEATKASAEEHGVVWSQIINAQSVPTEIYGIEGIPHIMLIGPDGTILKRNLRGEGIEAEVAKYVKARK